MTQDAEGNTLLNIDEARMFNVIQSPMLRRGELRLSANSPNFSLFTYTFSREPPPLTLSPSKGRPTP